MNGIVLAVLLVFALAATLTLMWLACCIDAYRLVKRERAYRQKWLDEYWEAEYRCPGLTWQQYAKQPGVPALNMPDPRLGKYEWPVFFAAAACFAGEVALLWIAFHTWGKDVQPQFTILCLYLAVVILAIPFWYNHVTQGKRLPGYARIDSQYRSGLPPMPNE